jgi:hypothetical protein
MPNRNLRSGRDWEEAVARYLREHGFPQAEVMRVHHPDRGDVGQVEDWTIECKGIGSADGPRTHQAAFRAWGGRDDAAEFRKTFLAGWEAGQAALGRFDMSGAVDQLGKARAQNGHPYGAVFRRRRNYGPAEGFAIMPVGQAVAIMRRLAEETEPEAVPLDTPF